MTATIQTGQDEGFRRLDEFTKADILEKVVPTYVDFVNTMQAVFKDISGMKSEMEAFIQVGYRLQNITDEQIKKLSRQSKIYFPELFRQKLSALMLSLPTELSLVNQMIKNITAKLARCTPQLNNLLKQHNLTPPAKEDNFRSYSRPILESAEDLLKLFDEYKDTTKEEMRQSLETKVRLEQAGRRTVSDPHVGVVREILAKADLLLDQRTNLVEIVGLGEADLGQILKRPAPDAIIKFADFTSSEIINGRNRILATLVWQTKEGQVLDHAALEFGLDGGLLNSNSSLATVKVKDGQQKIDFMLGFEYSQQASNSLEKASYLNAPVIKVGIVALRGTKNGSENAWEFVWDGAPYSQLTQAVSKTSKILIPKDDTYPIFTSCENSLLAKQVSAKEFLLYDTFLGKTLTLTMENEVQNAKISLDYDIGPKRRTILVLRPNPDAAGETSGSDKRLNSYGYSIFLSEGESDIMLLIEEGILEIPEPPTAVEAVYYHPKTGVAVVVTDQSNSQSENSISGKKIYSAVLMPPSESGKPFKLAEVNTLHLQVDNHSDPKSTIKSTSPAVFSPLYHTDEKKTSCLFLISLDPSTHVLARISKKGLQVLSQVQAHAENSERMIASRVISPALESIFQHQQLSSIGLFGIVQVTDQLKVRMNMYISAPRPAK